LGGPAETGSGFSRAQTSAGAPAREWGRAALGGRGRGERGTRGGRSEGL
ncbi:MAG: hypothetical protein AVDCRST_MAG14-1976, partial [uncultured Rubrobacteraceae bacterium]